MNYVEKTYEEIFEDALNDSLEKGLISHAEDFPAFIKNHQDISNYYIMDKSVIALMIAKIYKDITKVYESDKVEYAEGIDLDNMGDRIGILRPAATCAEVECEFTLTSILENDVYLPEGVIVATNSGIQYETIEPIYIATGDTSATVLTRAVNPGVDSKVVANAINMIVTSLEESLTVINHVSSSGGTEEYSDDEYRYLLMNWIKIYLKGSDEAYEYYFANFDGIDSYRIVPNWNGTGTVKCILDPGYDDQLNRAYSELQESVVQETEDITMFAPTNRFIDIYAEVNVDIDQINPYSSIEKENIKSRIISAVKIFIDGGYRNDGSWYSGLVLGEDFIPHKLAVFLDEEIPELKSIHFNFPEDYIRIVDDEIGVVKDIIIEMV